MSQFDIGLDRFLEQLRAKVSDPSRKEVVATIANDLTLIGLQATGRDVTAELRHLRAQTTLLASEEAELVRREVTGYLFGIVGRLVGAALAGL